VTKRKILLTLMVAVFTVGLSSGSALASPVIYTDRSVFNDAVATGGLGPLTLETFNNVDPVPSPYFTQGVGVSFNGFTVTATALNNHGVAVADGTGFRYATQSGLYSTIDGTPHLVWGRLPGVGTGNTGPTIDITFDAPITALGFDWKDVDSTDSYTLNVLDQSYGSVAPWPYRRGDGFFGLISDTAFSTITLVSGPNKGGIVEPMSLDNLVHNAPMVPLPGSLLLLGTGLVGLAEWRRFRKG
jgi:hypothetical protein